MLYTHSPDSLRGQELWSLFLILSMSLTMIYCLLIKGTDSPPSSLLSESVIISCHSNSGRFESSTWFQFPSLLLFSFLKIQDGEYRVSSASDFEELVLSSSAITSCAAMRKII